MTGNEPRLRTVQCCHSTITSTVAVHVPTYLPILLHNELYSRVLTYTTKAEYKVLSMFPMQHTLVSLI